MHHLQGKRFGRLVVQSRHPGKHKSHQVIWDCQCDCGVTTAVKSNGLVSGQTRSCGCLKRIAQSEMQGKRYGMLIALDFDYMEGGDAWWKFRCDCGKHVSLRAATIRAQAKAGWRTNCGCIPRHGPGSARWQGCGELSKAYWYVIQTGAKTRKIPLEISIEDAWAQFQKQERKCALSGLPLKFSERARGSDQTASLDRIDSRKGYIYGNIQWTHKHINVMKRDHPDAYFIELCHAVAKTHPLLDIYPK